jgi:hypothetical protein
VQGDPALAARHARRLLGFMSEVFAAALLTEAAGLELQHGHSRKALVARLFIEERLVTPERRGISEQEHPALRCFDQIAGLNELRVA